LTQVHVYVQKGINSSMLQQATALFPMEWHASIPEGGNYHLPALILCLEPPDGSLPRGMGICRIGSGAQDHGSFRIRNEKDIEGFSRGLFRILPTLMAAADHSYTKEFVDIGILLAAEKDLDRLLDLILTKVRQLTCSDAASLYLVRGEDADRHLIFKLAQNDSCPLSLKEVKLPLSKESLAGYVAITGETLRIDDAYQLPEGVPYSINRSIDRSSNYRSKSMLVIPMTNHQGEIIGVLQLINRKPDSHLLLSAPEIAEREVLPYDEEIQERITALANMAAVAIENSQLYDSIRNLFEGFVQASVTAIEQRDPTTKGHSLRVSILTVEVAKIIDRLSTRPFRDVKFSSAMIQEIKWAALLHDFGKVGVREEVLVKAKKLYPYERERVEQRFRYMRKAVEADILREKLNLLLEGNGADLSSLDLKQADLIHTLDAYLEAILKADLPTVLPEGDFEFLQKIQRWIYETSNGERLVALEPKEAQILSIRKGSLDERERLEIESHVTHTYNFLKKIPWTKDLKHIPEIAYRHHEKLNGRGYPLGLGAPEIPIQSRIMTVADIFDALSASDRPYKKAVPVDRALDILRMEAGDGQLDSEIVEVFIDAEIWKQTLHLRQTAS